MSFGSREIDQGALRQQVIEASVSGARRKVWLAYLLWFGLGQTGAHNFYLGKPVLGGLQLFGLVLVVLSAAGGVLALVGLLVIFAMCASLLVDAFLIPARARAYDDRRRAQLAEETGWIG